MPRPHSKRWSGGGEVAGRLPVESITVAARRYHPANKGSQCKSRPGHLLHLMEKGEYHLITNGRHYDLKAGDVIYYHDGEDVIWQPSPAVVFLAVGFFAPSLPAPPVGQRCFPSTREVRRAFRAAIAAAVRPHGRRRNFRLYAAVLDILGHLPWDQGSPGSIDPAAAVWWDIESHLRRDKMLRPQMAELVALSGCSESTIARSCRHATGQSPLRRVAALRLDEARGLLLYSDLNVSEVAARLGYPRMHEFSREFSKYYGQPPTAMRG